jgi:hypothetical protein
MNSSLRFLSFFLVSLSLPHLLPGAQSCANAPKYFEPTLQGGDGQRYPLTIGPVVWHLLGSGIYPVQGSDGRAHLAFAMQFTNVWSAPATIQSVEVVDPSKNNQVTGTNRVLALKNEDVTGQLRLVGPPTTGQASDYSRNLGGGQSGVMYFDVSYATSDEVPCSIALRVHSLQPDVKVLPESNLLSPPFEVSSQAPLVIEPPFKGDGWVNGNGCCLEVGPHRFVMNAMNGRLDPSEGFAIDWIKVDAEGKAFRGDGKKSENWLCYGVDVLAVGPGTVVETMRDLPDETPGVPPTITDVTHIAGNHVLLDLGGGHYAMYAHLAPKSLTVHVGDHVKSGDKIGLLGNSGNSTGPHLHFQISDRPSTLDVTSMPYVFPSMTLQARIPLDLVAIDDDSIKGMALPMNKSGAGEMKMVMPLSRDVVGLR